MRDVSHGGTETRRRQHRRDDFGFAAPPCRSGPPNLRVRHIWFEHRAACAGQGECRESAASRTLRNCLARQKAWNWGDAPDPGRKDKIPCHHENESAGESREANLPPVSRRPAIGRSVLKPAHTDNYFAAATCVRIVSRIRFASSADTTRLPSGKMAAPASLKHPMPNGKKTIVRQ